MPLCTADSLALRARSLGAHVSCAAPPPRTTTTAERQSPARCAKARSPRDGSVVLRTGFRGLTPGAGVLLRLLRKAEDHLADDVALHLTRPRVDRPRASVEERPDERRRIVGGTGVVGLERAVRPLAVGS